MSFPGLIIFDCDGVLVDSEVIASRVVSACLAEAGIAMSVDEVAARYSGVSAATMQHSLDTQFGSRLPRRFPEIVTARILDAFDRDLRAVDGVAEMLRALPYRVCVASSSAPERIRRSLEITGLIGFFDGHLFSATQVANGKPAPDLFLFAAATMGVAPTGCVVIEDSLPGIKAGRAAAMTVLGFYGGSHCQPTHGEGLTDAGADAVFGRMAELAPLLERLAADFPAGVQGGPGRPA